MIENDVVAYLKADATLISLLTITGGDGKFYPIIPKNDPGTSYVVYNPEIGDMDDEWIDGDRIVFTVVGTDVVNATAVRDRIKAMLDLRDEIQQTTLANNVNFYIYWSRLQGGVPVQDEDRGLYNYNMAFEFKYKAKC